MTDDAGFDHRDHAEFNRRMAALDDILNRHLGPPPNMPDALDAEYVMMALWLPAAGLGAMNGEREREKLRKATRLANELAETWRSVHVDVRTQMELLSRSIHDTESGMSSRDPLNLSVVEVLHEVVEQTLAVAEDVIDEAPATGRKNLVNIAIAERLRAVWQDRKRCEAPQSMTEAGPFAEYMIESFEALGSPKSARSALDAWRKFRANYPKAD